jgi:hypothetical protein
MSVAWDSEHTQQLSPVTFSRLAVCKMVHVWHKCLWMSSMCRSLVANRVGHYYRRCVWSTYPSKVQHSCQHKSEFPEQVLWSPRCPACVALRAQPVTPGLSEDIMDHKNWINKTWVKVDLSFCKNPKLDMLKFTMFCLQKQVTSLSKQREVIGANGV